MDKPAYRERKSVLIIGATGRTGLECLHTLARHPTGPKINAFCRAPSKLADQDKKLCNTIVQGNAGFVSDIERALRVTKADVVLVCIGTGNRAKKSNVRTASAVALASVLIKPEFAHVRATIVSSYGAGGSRILAGFGIGKLIEFRWRHVLKDHTGQEDAFRSSHTLFSRTFIIRPTSFTDTVSVHNVAIFGDTEKPKTIKTSRADVAAWVTKSICEDSVPGGKIVNLTGTTYNQQSSTSLVPNCKGPQARRPPSTPLKHSSTGFASRASDSYRLPCCVCVYDSDSGRTDYAHNSDEVSC